MTVRTESFLDRVREWARAEPGVRAALLVGSQARTDVPADEWADVDVVLLVDEPARFAEDAGWVSAFGAPELTFLEPTAVGGETERRVLFADGLEVDFALFPARSLSSLLADPGARATLARGHRVLHDELGLAGALAAQPEPAPTAGRGPAEIATDFWYHALWAAKKLLRGEAVTARFSLESHLKGLLLELARCHAAGRDGRADTWHGTRFAERWADARALEAIWSATALAPAAFAEALWRLCDAFDALAAETAPPLPGAAAARARLTTLLPPV